MEVVYFAAPALRLTVFNVVVPSKKVTEPVTAWFQGVPLKRLIALLFLMTLTTGCLHHRTAAPQVLEKDAGSSPGLSLRCCAYYGRRNLYSMYSVLGKTSRVNAAGGCNAGLNNW